MALTLREGAATEALPKIKLGGAHYFIAPLYLREILANIVLAPKVNATLRKWAAVLKNETEPDFEAEDFNRVVDFVVNGLRRLYPEVRRDDLLEQPISIFELLMATPVITGQSGGVEASDAGE